MTTWKNSPTGTWEVHPGDVPPHVELTPHSNFCVVKCTLCGVEASVFWVGARKQEDLMEGVVRDHFHGWEPPTEEVAHMTKIDIKVAEFPETELKAIAEADVQGLKMAGASYGNSWKKRGGVGAFMMLARKWDRLERQVERHGWDIADAIAEDQRAEGIMDDIRDLRRYLMLVEAEWGATVREPLK